jgi:hypothetical protein
MEVPGRTADEMAKWFGSEMQRYREDEAELEEQRKRRPRLENLMVNDQWKHWMSNWPEDTTLKPPAKL